MRSFYIEVDTNDGDYVGYLITIPKEDFERFKPLIEKIKNFTPYEGVSESGICYTRHHNFPIGDLYRPYLGDKSPQELYNITDEEYEDFIETFKLYGGEYGFHTITKIQEVILGEEIL